MLSGMAHFLSALMVSPAKISLLFTVKVLSTFCHFKVNLPLKSILEILVLTILCLYSPEFFKYASPTYDYQRFVTPRS